MMARALVRLLPIEMAVLGVFELALLFALAFAMLIQTGSALWPDSENLPRDCVVLAAMLALTIGATAATIGLYRPDVCLDRRRLLVSASIAALLAFPAILLVSGAYRVSLGEDHVLWLVRLLAIWLSFVLLVRFGFGFLASRLPMTRRVLVLGSGERAAGLVRRLAARRHALFEPVAPLALALDSATLVQVGAQRNVQGHGRAGARARLWGIVIAGETVEEPALSDPTLRGIPVYDDFSFQERHLGRIELDAIPSDATMFAGLAQNAVPEAVKRGFDIAISLVLMITTLPMMAITVLLIKLDSPGPVLYRQERAGLRGVPFTLLKFRSMAVDAEKGGQAQWAQQRDPRVTRVGAFIRASRIDELPQLINVLRGEMSMIGPRPERPIFVEQLARVIPFYDRRGDVKPGLTGWAQVNFPYGASVEDAREKLAYDLYYVKNRGLLLDFVILLSTVRVILFREGAR